MPGDLGMRWECEDLEFVFPPVLDLEFGILPVLDLERVRRLPLPAYKALALCTAVQHMTVSAFTTPSVVDGICLSQLCLS